MSDAQSDLDRELDLLADAADSEAIEAQERRVPPSFAAVLARAHRIDPASVDAEALDRATHPPVRASSPDPERALETLVAAARAEAEASSSERYRRPAPPLRRPARRTAAVVVGTLAAASAIAAAVTLVVSLRGDAMISDTARDSGSLAAARAEHDDAGGIAIPNQPQQEASPKPRRNRGLAPAPLEPNPVIEPDPFPTLDPDPDLESDLDPNPDPDPDPELESHPNPVPKNKRSRLQRLDDRARKALADGAIERADGLLAELIRRGGRHRLVEAAFGDRFAIAHRLHSAAEQRALWRAYLKRFPSGRFSDDARAGLCRRAPDDATACWSAYLEDFPRGAYRAQARRSLGEETP